MRPYDPFEIGVDRPRVRSPRPCVVASNLSVGSGVIVIFFCWAHLTASARFRVRAPGPVSGRLSTDRPAGGLHRSRWFPVAFRPPAFASRSSCSRRGVGPSSRSAYRTTGSDPDGVTTFRTHELRPGRAPSGPRGRRCSPRPRRLPGRAPAASQRPVPAPRHTSHRRGSRLTRHQRGFTQFARPVFPSPVAARMERAALGLYPGLRTPPTRSRTTHAEVGTGHRARTWNYTLNSHQSISNPVVHSMRATSRRTSPKDSSPLKCLDDESDDAVDIREPGLEAVPMASGCTRKDSRGRSPQVASCIGITPLMRGYVRVPEIRGCSSDACSLPRAGGRVPMSESERRFPASSALQMFTVRRQTLGMGESAGAVGPRPSRTPGGGRAAPRVDARAPFPTPRRHQLK